MLIIMLLIMFNNIIINNKYMVYISSNNGYYNSEVPRLTYRKRLRALLRGLRPRFYIPRRFKFSIR